MTAIKELGRLASERKLCDSIITPEIGERYELRTGVPAKRLQTGRIELRAATGRDWQNAYADLATSMKRQLAEIEGAAARQEAIKEMRDVLDRYKEFRASKARSET